MTKLSNRYSVITLFPELIDAFAATGIVRRACANGHVQIDTINPRDHATSAHRQVDDAPYGGGAGMVMMVEPVRKAIEQIRDLSGNEITVACLTPVGRTVNQPLLNEMASIRHLVLIAGRYEGMDERILERDVDMEISLGDFVLSGGEVAAMAIIDGIVRLLPGSLGSAESAPNDSFSAGLLEHPHYTRPEAIDGQSVPPVLLSGNHAEIERWRRKLSLGRTWERRPDLLEKLTLSPADKALLEEFQVEAVNGLRENGGGD